MTDGFSDEADRTGAHRPRPLWVAGLVGLLTATLLTCIVIMGAVAYMRWVDPESIECDGCIRPPDLFSYEWWVQAAMLFPPIALVAIGYAVPLMAITAYLERRPQRPRLAWPIAGAFATAPLACIWVFLIATGEPAEPVRALFAPIVIVAIIGMIGGTVAGAVRGGPRR